MADLHISVKFPNIAPTDLEDFRKHAAAATEIAAGETGTLRYEYYFSEDETSAALLETYADSEAVLIHLGNVTEHLGRLVELGGGMEVDVMGEPSAELVEAGAPFNPTYYAPFVAP